jgi:hypothetical protein
VTPPDELHSIPVSGATVASSNWSGYVDYGYRNGWGAVTSALGEYLEPYDHGTSCSFNSAVFWSGIGGYGSTPLAQDGTGINTGGLGQHQAWWEIYPQVPTLVPINLYATVGQQFKAEVDWRGNNTFQFQMRDASSGAYTSFYETSNSGLDGATGEYIAERPSYSGTLPGLTNFGTWNDVESWTNGSPQQNFASDVVNMFNGGTTLDATGTLANSDGGFNVTFKNCS